MTEAPKHRAGHSLPVLLFHTTHLHTKMPRLDNHANTFRTDLFLNRRSNLAGKPLLNLQTPREHIDEARYFAQADNALVRQIRHVALPKKRQQMVLAEAEELNVLHHHHFVIGNAKRGAIQNVFRVLQIAAGQEFQRLFVAFRRLAQSFAIRIFPDELDDFANMAGDAARVKRLLLVQNDLFRRLSHCCYPSNPSGLFPAYSKLLLDVSCTRTRSSFALGNGFSRRKISMHKFSVVGTVPRNASTSSFSDLWSNGSRTSRSTKLSRSARFAIIPVAGSTFPETRTSKI